MSQGRLLILDDEPAMASLIEAVAAEAGLDARCTTDPTAFFTALDAWKPTHIAVDLVMPAMDGVQVLEQLATRGCRAKIIITSGVCPRVLDAAGRSAGERGLDIAGVLSKPFHTAALISILNASESRKAYAVRPSSTVLARPDAASEISADDLRLALARRQLQVFYQPKVPCRSGMLAGFEALVRWPHPDLGMIRPDHFVPLAEKSGLIDALTDQVLDLGLDWFSRNQGEDPKVSLSVNMSARTLKDPQFVERLVVRCRERCVEPDRLTFELTESAAMEDPIASLAHLTRLRMEGFHLSIDDFGTGFSSMLQLVRLPFSEIKVDKSFVMRATQSQEARTVVKSIVDLGHSLGLSAVAEGVEDAETLAYLNDVGCDLAQGYFIARPMEGAAISGWVDSRWGLGAASTGGRQHE